MHVMTEAQRIQAYKDYDEGSLLGDDFPVYMVRKEAFKAGVMAAQRHDQSVVVELGWLEKVIDKVR